MKTSVLVDLRSFNFADNASFAVWLINEAKIPVQELGSQRGEGAYFRRELLIFYGISRVSTLGYCKATFLCA